MESKKKNGESGMSMTELSTWLYTVKTQAGLVDILWRNPCTGKNLSDTIRRLKKHRDKVLSNRSRLESWVGLHKPDGNLLLVCRQLYRQYTAELEELDKSIKSREVYLKK